MPFAQTTGALVLGGGLAGTLAALVLTSYVDHVTVVERDRFPPGPEYRKGTPQARHTHLLMAGGARTLDDLIPGVLDELTSAGAKHLGIPNQILASSPLGWPRRYEEMQFVLGCSRPFLDWFVRDKLAQLPIAFHEACEVTGLLGTPERITGATIRSRETGRQMSIEAPIVVDTTGSGSRSPEWLAELGLPDISHDTVDPGIVYSSRLYRVPAGMSDFPAISIQPDPHSTPPGKGGLVLPVEDNKWVVTVAGMRGAEPSPGIEAFHAFARSLRHPTIATLISRAEPLTKPTLFHAPVNRRRHFSRVPSWPSGLVVLGDAHCTFTPIYGHGMSAAINGVAQLRNGLDKALDFRTIQRNIARSVDHAWNMSVAQDIRYPHTVGGAAPGRLERLAQRYLARVNAASAAHPSCAQAMLDTYTLSSGPARLLAPRVVINTLRGPGRTRPTAEPPLTPAESEALQSMLSSRADDPGFR